MSSSSAKAPGAGRAFAKDAAAQLYLDLLRDLETWRDYELAGAMQTLGFLRISVTPANQVQCSVSAIRAGSTNGVSRKGMAHCLAAFLVWPRHGMTYVGVDFNSMKAGSRHKKSWGNDDSSEEEDSEEDSDDDSDDATRHAPDSVLALGVAVVFGAGDDYVSSKLRGYKPVANAVACPPNLRMAPPSGLARTPPFAATSCPNTAPSYSSYSSSSLSSSSSSTFWQRAKALSPPRPSPCPRLVLQWLVLQWLVLFRNSSPRRALHERPGPSAGS